MERRRYELSDEQWHQIEPFFPTYRTGRPPRHDNRTMFNALLYVVWFPLAGSARLLSILEKC